MRLIFVQNLVSSLADVDARPKKVAVSFQVDLLYKVGPHLGSGHLHHLNVKVESSGITIHI